MITFEPVIGLEVHAQLLTQSKLFCSCSTHFGSKPNSHVCPVCLGLPGTLPVLNRQAVSMGIRAARALGCTICKRSIFARKNYFYPDLPKGYQISQYDQPLAVQGELEIELDGKLLRAGITRVHLEEDAGKNLHGLGEDSLVDLNRAGVPLIEIVGEPDLRSSAQAAAYLRALRDVLIFLGVNDGNLEEGSFRCDANVSLRPQGTTTLGTRTELKNINSFRFVQRAIEAEITRQTAVLEAGGRVQQETRRFDPDTGLTQTLRSKEEAHDYRYFPEPDLPALELDSELLAEAQKQLTEPPVAIRKRWITELKIPAPLAQILTQHPEYAAFFEATCRLFPQPLKVANFVANDVLRGVKVHGLSAQFSVTPGQVAELLGLVEAGEINGKQAKDVFAALEGTERSARSVVEERGMRAVSDAVALRGLCERIVEQFPEQARAVQTGKKGVLGFLVGQAMKQTGGSANPQLVSQIMESILNSGEAKA